MNRNPVLVMLPAAYIIAGIGITFYTLVTYPIIFLTLAAATVLVFKLYDYANNV